MKTELEIQGSSLQDNQKLWVELKRIKTNDRDFASARALILIIEATDGWKEPKKIQCTAKFDFMFHETKYQKGQVVDLYLWEYHAVSRYLSPNTPLKPGEFPNPPRVFLPECPITKAEWVKAGRSAKDYPPEGFAEKPDKQVECPLTLDEWKKAGKDEKDYPPTGFAVKLAAFMIACLLFLASPASAQTQAIVTGGPGQFTVYSIAGLNGGTNNIVGTNYFAAPVTNTTSIVTNNNWSVVNGTATNTVTYTTNTVVNIPGLISLVNWDQAILHLGYQAYQGTGTNAIYGFSASQDGVNFTTNWLTGSIAQSGTAYSSTNIALYPSATASVPAYLRLD